MIGWLYRIIIGRFGCDHKWKIISDHLVNGTKSDGGGSWKMIVLQCEHCGSVKRKNLIP